MAKIGGTAALPVPSEFTVDSEGSANSSRWAEWIRRFTRYASACQIVDDAIKIDTLLVIAGEAVEQIYFLNSKNTDKYADVIAAIELHFKPYEDEDSSIILFRQIVQRLGENIEAYIIIINVKHAELVYLTDRKHVQQ